MRNGKFVVVVLLLALLATGCAARQKTFSSPAYPEPKVVEKRPAQAPMEPVEENAPAEPELGRKIIYTVDMTLVVKDVEGTADEAEKLAESLGGYVARASIRRSNGRKYATLTLRVPADRLDEATGKLKGMAERVDRYDLSTEDITSRYTDLQARLTNLEATEEELRAMLQEVRQKPNARAEDIMEVYRELAKVRGEIDQVKGQIQMWDKMVALATIDLRLTPVTEVAPAGGWRPSETVRRAVHALVSAMLWLANAFIWLVIYVLPVLLVVGGFLGAIFYLIRRFVWRRNSKSRSEE